MTYETIMVWDVGWVRTITLNRPERRNAMTPQMQDELIAAFEEAAVSDCRVVVLAGAGEAFCSGLDLSVLQGAKDKSAAEHRADAERVAKLFRTLYELPKPTIAKVQGAAVAGGTGLATICDFTLAGADGEVWVYGGADRVCAGAGVGLFGAADWGEAGARIAADGKTF